MTIAEIARAADVPLESVLRVLAHEDVSADVAARVRDAVERHGYGRLPQATADADKESERADALERVRRQLVLSVDGAESEPDDPASAGTPSESPGVMDALLHKLAQDVGELGRELGRARNERLEDLTLLVDLITTSWRAVDRRLERIDRKLERLEGVPEGTGRRRLP